MSDTQSQLPAGFDSLEPYVARWAIEGSVNRSQRRTDSTAAERIEFYEAVKVKAAEALVFLDRKPLGDLDPQEQRLMNLMLTFAHIALAVELQSDADGELALARAHMRITKTPADARLV